MKTILCYGDSNTYGFRPDNGERYDKSTRWTGILDSLLGESKAEVIEEGLVGRTTIHEDATRPGRKGIDFIVPAIESHGPVDWLVLMLGTNDCKTLYAPSADKVGYGIEQIISRVQAYDNSIRILLISPIFLGNAVWEPEYDIEFDRTSVAVSRELKNVYREIAERYGCSFLAASDYAVPSEGDREHMDESGHAALANAIYNSLIKEL